MPRTSPKATFGAASARLQRPQLRLGAEARRARRRQRRLLLVELLAERAVRQQQRRRARANDDGRQQHLQILEPARRRRRRGGAAAEAPRELLDGLVEDALSDAAADAPPGRLVEDALARRAGANPSLTPASSAFHQASTGNGTGSSPCNEPKLGLVGAVNLASPPTGQVRLVLVGKAGDGLWRRVELPATSRVDQRRRAAAGRAARAAPSRRREQLVPVARRASPRSLRARSRRPSAPIGAKSGRRASPRCSARAAAAVARAGATEEGGSRPLWARRAARRASVAASPPAKTPAPEAPRRRPDESITTFCRLMRAL